MTLPSIAVALLISFVTLQQDTEDHKLTVFHDDKAKVGISYPASFGLKSTSEKASLTARSNEKVNASHPGEAVSISSDNIPLIATTPPEVPFAMVQFSRFDGKSINKPSVHAGLRDLASGMMVPFARALIDPRVGTILPVDMGDHDGIALFGSGQLKSNSAKNMYVAIVCFISSGQDACVCDVSFNKAQLLDLLHDPIQFDGELAYPLIQKPIDF